MKLTKNELFQILKNENLNFNYPELNTDAKLKIIAKIIIAEEDKKVGFLESAAFIFFPLTILATLIAAILVIIHFCTHPL